MNFLSVCVSVSLYQLVNFLQESAGYLRLCSRWWRKIVAGAAGSLSCMLGKCLFCSWSRDFCLQQVSWCVVRRMFKKIVFALTKFIETPGIGNKVVCIQFDKIFFLFKCIARICLFIRINIYFKYMLMLSLLDKCVDWCVISPSGCLHKHISQKNENNPAVLSSLCSYW